jgi:teichuronic acid biosynthesis glycosyltransferase TuaC
VERKRILAVSYLFPNSQQPNHGIFVLNRLKAMSKYADVTVINPVPTSAIHKYVDKFKFLEKIPESEILQGVNVYHPKFFSIPRYFKFIEIWSYKRAVMRVIKEAELEFDLIDLHWTFPDLPTGRYLSRKYALPFNITLRGMEAFHIQDGGIRQSIVAKSLRFANKVVALSEEMANTANAIAQTGNKTAVVRNGVDVGKFFYQDKRRCRNQLGLEQRQKIILGVGALIHRKGFDLVIEALASLTKQERFSHLVFYILGSEGAEGDYSNELKESVSKHKLEAHVLFHGAVPNEQLVTWYNSVDVFCLSSRGEGSPNVLTEALACGTPSVAAKVGSVPETMSSEPNLGEVFESDNLTQLIEALERTLLQDFDREKNAKGFSKYTWDWCAKRVLSFYF